MNLFSHKLSPSREREGRGCRAFEGALRAPNPLTLALSPLGRGDRAGTGDMVGVSP